MDCFFDEYEETERKTEAGKERLRLLAEWINKGMIKFPKFKWPQKELTHSEFAVRYALLTPRSK